MDNTAVTLLLRLETMAILGKAIHISVDLVLLLTVLAGIRRNTGITPKLDTVDLLDMRYYVGKYLNVGETVFDHAAAYLGSSDYFTRK